MADTQAIDRGNSVEGSVVETPPGYHNPSDSIRLCQAPSPQAIVPTVRTEICEILCVKKGAVVLFWTIIVLSRRARVTAKSPVSWPFKAHLESA